MRVFWPQNCLTGLDVGDTALLVGWNNPGGDIVVVTAVPFLDIELASQLLLQDGLFDTPPTQNGRTASDLYQRLDNRSLSVVGTYYSKNGSHKSISGQYITGQHIMGQHITEQHGITVGNGTAVLQDRIERLLIYYDPPNPSRMQFFTLNPSTLYKTEKSVSGPHTEALEFHLGDSTPRPDNLSMCIAQMNCVFDLQPVIRRNAIALFSKLEREPLLIKRYQQRHQKPRRRGSLSLDMVAKVASHRPFLFVIIEIRRLVEHLLVFLETAKFKDYSILTLFCTAQQVHLRLNQLCHLPLEYIGIQRRSKNGWHWLQPERNNAYIRFNNHIWLVLNDLALGLYFFSILQTNTELISSLAEWIFQDLMINYFIRVTNWLTLWPAGFKLNTQLGQFMGEITIWTIHTWSVFGSLLFNKQVTTMLVNIISFSGLVGGVTLQISLVVDLLSFAGFHIYILCQCMSRVYFQQLNVLTSLFRLFRGRKYNKLRNRVDHGNYDFHQLFLGTILFTVTAFLLPTVFAYYMVFTVASLTIFFTVAVLCVLLSFLNHFPLFPLLLRVKSPGRVPSGIYFTSGDIPDSLRLRSKAMLLSEIFKQYTDTINRFAKNTLNVETISGLITGRSLTFQQAELYASLYSVLPQHRRSVDATYHEICAYLGL